MAGQASKDWQHGCMLAVTFGMGLRFTCSEVEVGTSFSDGTNKFIAIYPEKYAGNGGGMMRANLDDMPVFELPLYDREQADELVEAFNYFAAEGRI